MDIFREIIEYLGIDSYFQIIGGGFGIVMGMVYTFTKLLELIRSNRNKSIIALSTIVVWTTVVHFSLISRELQTFFIVIGWSIVLYVLLGLNLYRRSNKFQDNKFGEVVLIDEEGNEKTFQTKRPPRRRKPTKKAH